MVDHVVIGDVGFVCACLDRRYFMFSRIVRKSRNLESTNDSVVISWNGKCFLIGGFRMKCPKVLTVVAATLVLSLATAMAQSYLDAGSKARGDYSSSSVSRLLGSARGSAQDYRDYASGSKNVDPEVAKDASDAIGDYISKSKKHLAWMRASAQHGSDKETLTSLDQIDKDIAAAENAHQKMHDLCSQKTVDAAGSMKCCEQIDDSLGKAITEHNKLMKRLGLAMPAPLANVKSR